MITARHLDASSTEKELDDVYRLRFQVYCQEKKFLDPAYYPDGREVDEYDSVSEHFSAVADGETVGTSRLVKWTEGLSFPSDEYFHNILQQIARLHFPLEATSEISRLCISKMLRRRTYDGMGGWGLGTYDNSDRRKEFPSVTMKLFKAMYQACRDELGITHLIAAFEDSLYRSLNRAGLQFSLLSSQTVDYYGLVKMYGASIQQLDASMKFYRPDLYFYFKEDQPFLNG